MLLGEMRKICTVIQFLSPHGGRERERERDRERDGERERERERWAVGGKRGVGEREMGGGRMRLII